MFWVRYMWLNMLVNAVFVHSHIRLILTRLYLISYFVISFTFWIVFETTVFVYILKFYSYMMILNRLWSLILPFCRKKWQNCAQLMCKLRLFLVGLLVQICFSSYFIYYAEEWRVRSLMDCRWRNCRT
jgi:hypothetical protein